MGLFLGCVLGLLAESVNLGLFSLKVLDQLAGLHMAARHSHVVLVRVVGPFDEVLCYGWTSSYLAVSSLDDSFHLIVLESFEAFSLIFNNVNVK